MNSRLLRCLHLLCVAIWVFPVVLNAIIVADDDAAKKNLDSVYIGTISATLNSTSKPTSCFPANLKFGPIDSSRLTLGPNHNGWFQPNPFFLAIVGGKQGKLLGSVQSSLTSPKGNKTWWSVQAWQHGGPQGPYEIEGTMILDVDDEVGEERNQLSGVWEVGNTKTKRDRRDNELEPVTKTEGNDSGKEADPCKKGTKQLLIWRHKKHSTLKGQLGAQDAKIVVIGTVVLTLGATKTSEDKNNDKRNQLLRRAETQEMAYALTFTGKHYSGSAPLPLQGLAWDKAGPGPPLEPFQFFNMEIPKIQDVTSTTKPTKTATLTELETTILVTTTVVITQSPTHSPPPGNDHQFKSPLPHGAIVSIVVGGVLAVVVFLFMLFLVKRWLAKRKEPKFYPELAYIYSTPFTSTNRRSQGGGASGGLGAASSATAVSSSAQRGAEEGTYYGPTAPQLEVDLGDNAPFSESVAAPRVGERASGIGNRSRAMEREDLEKEMMQPMLPGASSRTYSGGPPARMRGGMF